MDTEGEWLEADQLRSWLAVVSILDAIPNAIDAQLKRDASLNHFEYSIIAGLTRGADRTLAMSDLATIAFGSLSRLSHAVDRLEKRGLVERCEGAKAHRNAVRLTDLGQEHLETVAPSHVREVRRLLVDPLTEDEFAMLGSIARKVLEKADPKRAEVLRRMVDEPEP